jgi:hypothetical protein
VVAKGNLIQIETRAALARFSAGDSEIRAGGGLLSSREGTQ